MATVSALEEAPALKPGNAYAFFDVDDTLVSLKTMFTFAEFYWRHVSNVRVLGAARQAVFAARFALLRRLNVAREVINRDYYRQFRGRPVSEIEDAVREWYSGLRRRADLFHPAVLGALEEHRRDGLEPVLVSGSSQEILAPLAAELGINHVLATRLERRRGRLTGEIIPPQTIGKGKALAVLSFLREVAGDGSRSFAYGDHDSDVPMLECVGNAVVVTREERMRALARSRVWAVLEPWGTGDAGAQQAETIERRKEGVR
jgi:HAD superfamily hydrolase (TIGR01490 family)